LRQFFVRNRFVRTFSDDKHVCATVDCATAFLCDSFFNDKHVCAKHDCATVFSTTSTFVRQFFVRQLFCATTFLCERGAAPRTTVNKFLRLFITVNVDVDGYIGGSAPTPPGLRPAILVLVVESSCLSLNKIDLT
jgi:hypothetical protein